jgi:hypothetical protein
VDEAVLTGLQLQNRCFDDIAVFCIVDKHYILSLEDFALDRVPDLIIMCTFNIPHQSCFAVSSCKLADVVIVLITHLHPHG